MIKKRIEQFWALSLEEWRVLLVSLLLLPLAAVSLQVFGLYRTRLVIERFASTDEMSSLSSEERMEFAMRVARMVNVAARHGPYRANCLKRSLVTWGLLIKKGLAADLMIGVGSKADEFLAHAWVEFEGVALAEPLQTSVDFTAFKTVQDGSVTPVTIE